MRKDYVIRYENNPILTVNDIPYTVETVHNAGVVKYDSKYIMLFRSHRKTGRSIIGIAESKNGFDFVSKAEPFMIPANNGIFKEYEEFGVEDPRITFIEDAYYITYSAYSRHGVRIGLAKTLDFESVERIAFITQADYRNTVLFPEKINGRYVKLDRPHSDISPWSIWISYSPDLKYWGDCQVLLFPREGYWDSFRVGLGPPPIETPEGWLILYHGIRDAASGKLYRVGLALLDLDEPWKVIRRSKGWILSPQTEYEQCGDIPGVVSIPPKGQTSSGISINPIVNMTGQADYYEVYFDSVRVPKSNRVGQENQGWYVALTTLAFERSAIGAYVAQTRQVLQDLVQFAGETKRNGQSLYEDPLIGDERRAFREHLELAGLESARRLIERIGHQRAHGHQYRHTQSGADHTGPQFGEHLPSLEPFFVRRFGLSSLLIRLAVAHSREPPWSSRRSGNESRRAHTGYKLRRP